jgi:hypothetical protein
MSDTTPPLKTPMFEAMNASRYHRQELYRRIQRLAGGNHLIAYVSGGPDSTIDRSDIVHFNDLVYSLPAHCNIDFLLHTPGGDIDVAEKLISLLAVRLQPSRLRVVVPDFAKSAGTLMAIAADAIVMSDTSELGPIDPQALFTDGDGNSTNRSVLAYLDAYEDLRQRVNNPDDQAAHLLLTRLEPDQIDFFKKLKLRTQRLAEGHLRRGMCKEKGNVTAIATKLLEVGPNKTHGQPITAAEADAIGLTIEYLPHNDAYWDACWRLYCLLRLTVKNGQKIFESEIASVISES